MIIKSNISKAQVFITIFILVILYGCKAERSLIIIEIKDQEGSSKIEIKFDDIEKIGLNERMGAGVGLEIKISQKYREKIRQITSKNIGEQLNLRIGREVLISATIYESVENGKLVISYATKNEALDIIKKFGREPDYHLQYTAEELKEAESYLKPARNPYWKKSVEALNKGDIDKAEKSAKDAIKSDPKEPSHHHLLGFIYHQKKSLALALEQYQKAKKLLKAGRKFPGLYLSIGQIYEESGDHKSAIQVYKEYLSKNGNYLLINEALAVSYEKVDDHNSALKQYRLLVHSKVEYFEKIGQQGIRRVENRD